MTVSNGRISKFLRDLDNRLGTRPLLATLLTGEGLGLRDRVTVVFCTVRAVVASHGDRFGWCLREAATGWWLKYVNRGMPSRRGLSPVAGLRDWWQPNDMAAVHRCRIALGRLRGAVGRGSITLFCGQYPADGPLPVYVLFDCRGRVIEMAFHDGNGRLSPGVGDLSRSPVTNTASLLELSAHLKGGDPDEDTVVAFTRKDRV